MTIDEFIEEKIKLETKKILALKAIYDNHWDELSSNFEEDNFGTFEDWNNFFEEETDTFGDFYFNGDSWEKVER